MLQIRKRVSLDFLGDEYKDSYLIFKAIPIKDYEVFQDEIEKIKDDNKAALDLIRTKLKKYYISGKVANESGQLEDVTVADLDELDRESTTKCFEMLTGQNVGDEQDFLDKDSKSPSSTTPKPQSNS